MHAFTDYINRWTRERERGGRKGRREKNNRDREDKRKTLQLLMVATGDIHSITSTAKQAKYTSTRYVGN